MQSSSKQNLVRKNKNRTKFIILFTLLTVGALLFFFRYPIIMGYYYLLKFDHFKPGDKVFVSQSSYIPDGVLTTVQYIVPINNSNDNGYAMFLGPYFELNKAKERKSGFIGTFKEYRMIHTKTFDGKNFIDGLYAIIIPDTSILETRIPITIPTNYRLKDSTIYMFPLSISNHDLAEF